MDSATLGRTVFVIRDFEVDKSVGLALQFLAQFPPSSTILNIPGIPGAAQQGRLIEDIVDPAIAKSQYVVAFMDTPNANVGFELGFALGSNRHVALVCAATELPKWLDAAPLAGYLVAKGVQLTKLQKIIELGEHLAVDGSPKPGTDVLFLASRADEGLVGHALVARQYPDWRLPEHTGWKLQDLPRQLDGVGEVVWLITPFAKGADRKDGQGNSLNAIIAGYAKGKGIPLRILKSAHHRRIVDIEDYANLFTNLDELQNLFKVAEEKRKAMLAGKLSTRQRIRDNPLEPVFSRESVLGLKWYEQCLERARAVGRVSLDRVAKATCFLVSPRYVLTPRHVVSMWRGDAWDVVFEAINSIQSAKVVWCSSDVDLAVLELEAPVTGALPLVLEPSHNVEIGSRVVVVGYPHGGALSFSLQDSELIEVADQYVRYTTPTSPGSSGSPVFDHDWNLLAMHYMAKRGDGATISEGVPVDTILSALSKQQPAIYSELFRSNMQKS